MRDEEDANDCEGSSNNSGEVEDPGPACRDEASSDEKTENLLGRKEEVSEGLELKRFIAVRLTLATAPDPPKLKNDGEEERKNASDTSTQ